MTESPKRRVALIGTGGTISSIGRDSLDVWEYMDTGKKVGPDELLARVPEMAQVAEIVPVPFQSVGSTSIGPAEWLLLTETIHGIWYQLPTPGHRYLRTSSGPRRRRSASTRGGRGGRLPSAPAP